MIDSLAKKNIDTLIHEMAMVARGMVITHEATKEEVFDYIMESGNAEFERIFTAPVKEVLCEMLEEMTGIEIPKEKGETK